MPDPYSSPDPVADEVDPSSDAAAPGLLTRLRRIGPAIIVAAVVLGPGSIVSASRVGCQYGYDLLWLVPLAGLLMTAMTIAAMANGALHPETPCSAVAKRFGRPAAWMVGGSMLVAVTMFQASNNNAMLMAVEGFTRTPGTAAEPHSVIVRVGIPLLLNLGIIAMLILGKRNLYRWIESAMALLVAAMVLAFAANMLAATPSPMAVARGLVPKMPNTEFGGAVAWLTAGAMVATTFSVAGAFYQSYQVREKGWGRNDLSTGVTDSVVGIATLALITMMILITGAAALGGRVKPSELTDAAAVAQALEPMFGRMAQYVFAAGVFAGAISSFVVNALIGGVVFADSINIGSKMSQPGVRNSTIGVLMLGWLVAAVAIWTETPLADFIIIAQSLTVLAFPILAATVIWQYHQVDRSRLPGWVLPACWLGLLVAVGLSIRTVAKLVGG
ncbi:NRAMP family divalent metal transporter [Stieleria varia]|uniref:Divalent metal cation transporter MntH n=1 Tax=Stieleria varia TaxID=2528005 RepID=A0A5C6A1W0_9BACT|nr:divalent metal cation transporter [Stieleria varia]TWT93834.1 Divalent metal cation transporter MntH [Stieleria varia]